MTSKVCEIYLVINQAQRQEFSLTLLSARENAKIQLPDIFADVSQAHDISLT